MGPPTATPQLRPERPPPSRRWRVHLHKPRKSRRFYSGAVALALGVTIATTGFEHALTRIEHVASYTSSGAFAYRAHTAPNGAAAVRFDYRFRSRLPHNVHGTIALQELFVAEPGWRDAYRLATPRPFSGDRTSVTATLSARELLDLLSQLQHGAYRVRLQALVNYAGTVDGHAVQGSFEPSLPFNLNPLLVSATVPGRPGASPWTLEGTLQPTSTGTLPRTKMNLVSLAGVRAPALDFRIGGVLLALAALFVVVTSQRRRRDIWSHEKRVAYRAGRVLAEVVNLEQQVPPGSVLTDVASFENLVALAVQADHHILHEIRPEAELFAVDDPPRMYIYRRPLNTLRIADVPSAASA